MCIDVSSHLFKPDGRNDAHGQKLHHTRGMFSKEFVLQIKNVSNFRALTHQTDIKERRAASKAGYCVASLRLSVDFVAS